MTQTTKTKGSDIDLDTVSVDSPLLTAYDSGRARARQGRPLPAGATRELARGYYDEEMAMAEEA